MTVATRAGSRPVHAGPFQHVALFYGSRQRYLAEAGTFAGDELAAGAAVLIVVPQERIGPLRARLGDRAGAVTFADVRAAGRNPARLMPLLLNFAGKHPGRRVSIVVEAVWSGRSALEYPACAVHEALVNVAFAGRDTRILCPYDVRALPARSIDDARRSHPVLISAGARRPSRGYANPLDVAERFNRELPAPPPGSASQAYRTAIELAALRRFVADRARSAGLSPDRVADLVVAVNELTTNTLEHTAGAGTLTVWRSGGLLVCQVDDEGRWSDPLAGLVLPPVNRPGGRGLVPANQLCDLVRVYRGPGRTSTRVYVAP